MSDYVNFGLFLLSFVVVGFFWNRIFAPLRKNESFRDYLKVTGLVHMGILLLAVGFISFRL